MVVARGARCVGGARDAEEGVAGQCLPESVISHESRSAGSPEDHRGAPGAPSRTGSQGGALWKVLGDLGADGWLPCPGRVGLLVGGDSVRCGAPSTRHSQRAGADQRTFYTVRTHVQRRFPSAFHTVLTRPERTGRPRSLAPKARIRK